MPRARSPDSVKAEEMYHSGKLLKDIAEELGVPASTVRRWKATQKWDGSESERSDSKASKKKASARKRKGAPKGNQNAKGGRGNPHPKPPIKHGGYSAVYWDTLDEEEKAMIEDMQDDPEIQLIDQIKLFTVRERRLMKAIKQYSDPDKKGVYISQIMTGEDKRKFKSEEEEEEYRRRVDEKVESGDRMPGERYHMETLTQATIDVINRLERELTSVQSKKTKAIEALNNYRIKKAEADGAGRGSEVVRAWAEAVIRKRGEKNDG